MEWLNRLLGRDKETPPTEDQSARMVQLPKEFADHPGKNLTPARAATLLLDAEQGNLRALADLADDMEERDTHLFSELSKRRRTCQFADWKLELHNPDATEQKAMDQLTEIMRDVPVASLIWDMTDAIHKSYSCVEQQWERVENQWLPTKLQHRSASWFMAAPDARDTLLLRTDSGTGEPLQPFSWITHIHKARSGYLTNTALARVLVWPFLFRAFSSRDFAEFLEIYGLPVRLGRYPSGSTTEERNTLLRAVTAIGHNAAGIIPANMAIEFQQAAEGQADPYMAMVAWAERGISKAILGGTLTSEVDGKGSYAAANVHDDVRLELRQADLRMISATLTHDLIRPLALFNTALKRTPRLVLDDTVPEDLQLYADALPKLAAVMPIPLAWAQSKLKIPAPNNDEPLLTATQQQNGQATLAHKRGCSCCSPVTALKSGNDQGDIQDSLDDTIPPELQNISLNLIKPLLDKAVATIKMGESPEGIMSELLSGYPDLEASQLQDTLAKAFLIADLAGQWEAQRDVANDKS